MLIVIVCYDRNQWYTWSLYESYKLNRMSSFYATFFWIRVVNIWNTHISPVLRQLHWLPVHQRITFKLAILVYKSLYDLVPQYLVEDSELVAAADLVSYDRRTLPRSLFHEPTLVSAIRHSQLLDHDCGTAFHPTYDSPTLPFITSAGR